MLLFAGYNCGRKDRLSLQLVFILSASPLFEQKWKENLNKKAAFLILSPPLSASPAPSSVYFAIISPKPLDNLNDLISFPAALLPKASPHPPFFPLDWCGFFWGGCYIEIKPPKGKKPSAVPGHDGLAVSVSTSPSPGWWSGKRFGFEGVGGEDKRELPRLRTARRGRMGRFVHRIEPNASPYVTFWFILFYILFFLPSPLFYLYDSRHFVDSPSLCLDPALLPPRSLLLLTCCLFSIAWVGNTFVVN